MKESIETQKSEINQKKIKIDHIKVEIINEEINLSELQYLNKLEKDHVESKYGDMAKKVYK